MSGIPLHGNFMQPCCTAPLPCLLAGTIIIITTTTTTISKVIQRVYSRCKGGNKNVPHHNFGVHAPPKMTFCQPNSGDNHAALYISTDPQTFVLTTFQPWRREVWMDLGPFGASHKQEQAFAKHLKTTHYWNIHSSLAKTKSNASLSAIVSPAALRFSYSK